MTEYITSVIKLMMSNEESNKESEHVYHFNGRAATIEYQGDDLWGCYCDGKDPLASLDEESEPYPEVVCYTLCYLFGLIVDTNFDELLSYIKGETPVSPHVWADEY